MNFNQNYFELFDLPVSPRIDKRTLTKRYRELQRTVHPDRYVTATEHEQRMALQYATWINEAYEVLGSDLKRYIYLLELAGVTLPEQALAQVEPAFLLQQIELRERLEDIADATEPAEQVEQLRQQLAVEVDALSDHFSAFFEVAERPDLSAAAGDVQKLQYLVKIQQELHRLEESLLDGGASR